MMEKYSAGFLIPKDVNRVLGDNGWEFESSSRLPADIELLFKSELSLCESSLDFAT